MLWIGQALCVASAKLLVRQSITLPRQPDVGCFRNAAGGRGVFGLNPSSPSQTVRVWRHSIPEVSFLVFHFNKQNGANRKLSCARRGRVQCGLVTSEAAEALWLREEAVREAPGELQGCTWMRSGMWVCPFSWMLFLRVGLKGNPEKTTFVGSL